MGQKRWEPLQCSYDDEGTYCKTLYFHVHQIFAISVESQY